MTLACELLAAELRLDEIEAEVAIELPAHLRSFARAYADGRPAPPAPCLLQHAATLAAARAALSHPLLADRGLALLRLAAPVVLESDAAVIAARAAEPSWPALAALAARRDAAALARFGRRALDLLHWLHGSAPAEVAPRAGAGTRDGGPLATAAAHGTAWSAAGSPVASAGGPSGRRSANAATAEAARGPAPASRLPSPVAGWREPDGVVVDERGIAERWRGLCLQHGVAGAVSILPATARPRAFIVELGREVALVLPPRIVAPADRFAVLHELGHAVAALACAAPIPRLVDEAAAAYVASAIERPDDPWHSPLAAAARVRRTALAAWLDAAERRLPELAPTDARGPALPPWALWHDPGAQAAYVAAEALAADVERDLGAAPGAGQLAARLAEAAQAIDRRAGALDP